MIGPIKLAVPQRFGGRKPLVPIKYEVFSNRRRVEVTCYSRTKYRQYMKHFAYNSKTGKTIAEHEGVDMPEPTVIRINKNCSIIEVE